MMKHRTMNYSRINSLTFFRQHTLPLIIEAAKKSIFAEKFHGELILAFVEEKMREKYGENIKEWELIDITDAILYVFNYYMQNDTNFTIEIKGV